MRRKERILLIFAKIGIVLLLFVTGYWSNYFYQEIKYNHERKERFREYNSRPIDSTTRGGYAEPSQIEIPNTTRPDTLKR